jgi:hypothetical protein
MKKKESEEFRVYTGMPPKRGEREAYENIHFSY